MSTSVQRRQFQDVFAGGIVSGFATSAGTAIASGAHQALTITVPGVASDGTWEVLAATHSGALNGCVLDTDVTAANTVTVYIQNLSGGSQTPPAQKIVVVCARIDSRFTFE